MALLVFLFWVVTQTVCAGGKPKLTGTLVAQGRGLVDLGWQTSGWSVTAGRLPPALGTYSESTTTQRTGVAHWYVVRVDKEDLLLARLAKSDDFGREPQLQVGQQLELDFKYMGNRALGGRNYVIVKVVGLENKQQPWEVKRMWELADRHAMAELRSASSGTDASVAPESAPKQEGQAVQSGSVAAVNAATGGLGLTSVPDGADIVVDGNFVGNTPANLKLPGGKHTVSIQLQGYEQWKREITILVGSDSKLNAVLQKQDGTNGTKR